MNAEAKHIRKVLASQLSDLSDSFGASVGNIDKLTDVQQRIGQLLDENGDSEPAIRQVLRDRLDAGDIPTATYQLINSMIDRIVSEDTPTSPGNISYNWDRPPALQDDSNEPSPGTGATSTTVLARETFEPVSADDQVQVGSVLRDRFLLQKRISGGNMGVVYKALDRRLAEIGTEDPYVAIKVLSPKLANNAAAFRALQQEATKGRCLAHPGIVRFIDFDREGDVYFIVMEWLPGQTLAAILDSPEGKKFDVERSLEIVRQVGAALGYAHRCGIVHADVKPGNIMMLPGGEIKLFDFGIARVRQSHKQAQDDFDPGVLGAVTPAYSSMQVLTGEEPVPSDDVFSLGCLLYRLVAGYRVFGPRNAAEAATAGMQPQRLEALSDRQWAALAKAISYSRVTRFATVAGFLEELDRAHESAGPSGGDASKPSVAPAAEPHRDAPEPSVSRVAPPRDAEPVVVSADDGLVRHGKRRSRYLFVGLVALLGVSLFAGYRYGAFDDALERFDRATLTEPLRNFFDERPETASADRQPVDPSSDVAASGAAGDPAESSSLDPAVPLPGTADDLQVNEPVDEMADQLLELQAPADLASRADEDPGTDEMAVQDFSLLPPADIDISLIETANDSAPIIITLREDGEPKTIDLLRIGTLESPLQIRIEEVGYSGNRSPWASGQYTLSEDAVIEIPARQDRARVTLQMTSDPLRESDQLSTLRVRQADSTRTQLATMEIVLEDDDQRRFESGLPANTVAFAVSQIAVRESDPAAQIDVLRFNPDDQPIVVGYAVRDVNATEGADYFAPSGYSISFGPRQRSARLLIPLVQDSLVEGDEAFVVELATQDADTPAGVFQRIVVMIRDDDIAGR